MKTMKNAKESNDEYRESLGNWENDKRDGKPSYLYTISYVHYKVVNNVTKPPRVAISCSLSGKKSLLDHMCTLRTSE